jgi:hypothetical protein
MQEASGGFIAETGLAPVCQPAVPSRHESACQANVGEAHNRPGPPQGGLGHHQTNDTE